MKSQYDNISVFKLKQLSKTYQSESNVKCKHSLIDYCGSQVTIAVKCNPPRSPKIGKGNPKNYCQCYETLPDCVVSPYEGIFIQITYQSVNGQTLTIKSDEEAITTTMFNTKKPRGLILYSPMGSTTLGSVSDNITIPCMV